ncbi:DNA helicase [Microbacterium hominis]|uniref:DNA helicase n=1 Tax=Microbacterium hominis TaxID=162426 RepID=A0A7D4UI19_9MICO|nr:DNA helicase [Microbacterium hominis]QKJ17967.1 DNA helicase [Microbacterium hominis]
MSLSRKRKKELKQLQKQANTLWESQQVLVGEAASVAREASRQLGHFGREQVAPTVQATYDQYAAPYVDKSMKYSKNVLENKIVPTAGAVVGSALSVWDAANETRERLAAGKGLQMPDAKTYAKKADKYSKSATKKLSKKLSAIEPASQKQGMGAGGVIALILGIAAAAGVIYAAWQTLRADDELWVADDPLRAPDA